MSKKIQEVNIKREFDILSYLENDDDNVLRKTKDFRFSKNNRYSDIIPYTENMINLKSKDYINASIVKVIYFLILLDRKKE